MKDLDFNLSFIPLFQSESLGCYGPCNGEIEYVFPPLMDDTYSDDFRTADGGGQKTNYKKAKY